MYGNGEECLEDKIRGQMRIEEKIKMRRTR